MPSHNSIICLVIFLSITANAGADSNPTFIGRYQGGGRACYGQLSISAQQLSWHTPYSLCQHLPYKIIQTSPHSRVYYLKQHNNRCRYRVLALTHLNPSLPTTDWELIAYQSFPDYQAHALPKALACALNKLP